MITTTITCDRCGEEIPEIPTVRGSVTVVLQSGDSSPSKEFLEEIRYAFAYKLLQVNEGGPVGQKLDEPHIRPSCIGEVVTKAAEAIHCKHREGV